MKHVRAVVGAGSRAESLSWVDRILPDGTTTAHQFQPQGFSAFRIGSTGSVAVHTWPEHDLATLDLYGSAATFPLHDLHALGLRVVEEPVMEHP